LFLENFSIFIMNNVSHHKIFQHPLISKMLLLCWTNNVRIIRYTDLI
jgi:hypothetical protein